MLGDIRIYFNHYKSFEQAVLKWEERTKRIDLNNIFIIAQDWVSDNERLSRAEVEAWGKVKCKNLVMFTQIPYDDLPYTRFIDKQTMKNFLVTNKITGLRKFELVFNYAKWLNTEL